MTGVGFESTWRLRCPHPSGWLVPPSREQARSHSSTLAANVAPPPMLPHTTPPSWPADLPPTRFAAQIRTDSAEGCAIALLGLPDDLGVRLNGGRPGAAEGPTAFLAALAR